MREPPGPVRQWRLTHATAVLLGPTAVLIRGPSGSGKSRLAFALLSAASARGRLARLVGDDCVELNRGSGRLLARGPRTIAGLIEIRGVGIVRVPHEPMAAVGLVVDLLPMLLDRLPQARGVEVEGIPLPALALGGNDPRAVDIVLGRVEQSFRPREGDTGPADAASADPGRHPLHQRVASLR